MTDIYNTFTRPVILADNRDADTSWDNHLDRGSLGGVDLAYEYGAVVHANADGVVEQINPLGTGGRTARLRLADGRSIEYMHLSAFLVANGAEVSAGDPIARSGASGYTGEWNYDPHLHVHGKTASGQRFNIFNHFVDDSAPAGGNETPIVIPELEDIEMSAIKFGHRNTDGDEWMIVHPDIQGPTSAQRGFMTTTSINTAIAWSRLYKDGWQEDANDRYDFDVPRHEYIVIQNAAQGTFDARTRAETIRKGA